MGGEQAARTMQIVGEAALARKGIAPDPAQSQAQYDKIVAMFEAQADVFYTSGLVLDDGVIDPRDTRAVLALPGDVRRRRGAAAAAHAVRRGAHVHRFKTSVRAEPVEEDP
jgi:acetyl-CoA carboxylase carboxyltransferase component